MRPSGSPEELQRRRLRAVELLEEGYEPVEVARIVGVDRRSVRRWKSAYRKKGVASLVAHAASGRPPKLGPAQTRQLERELLRGAQAAGFATDLWTCPRVEWLIEQRFGVRYHVDHVCRLLHNLGWSPQKPARRALERDEDRIQRWVKHDWPAIKKKRTG
jgi:transposase